MKSNFVEPFNRKIIVTEQKCSNGVRLVQPTLPLVRVIVDNDNSRPAPTV